MLMTDSMQVGTGFSSWKSSCSVGCCNKLNAYTRDLPYKSAKEGCQSSRSPRANPTWRVGIGAPQPGWEVRIGCLDG